MNVNGKYIKDESGNIISPITSTSTVFDSQGRNLDDSKLSMDGGYLKGNILCNYSNIDATKLDNNITNVNYPTTFSLNDKNNKIMVRNEGIIRPNGNIEGFWYIRNYDTNGNQLFQKGIRLVGTKNGEYSAIIDLPLYTNSLSVDGRFDVNNSSMFINDGEWLNFPEGGGIMFKEEGYGDKFLIYPEFGGAGSSNILTIKSTTGGADEDPTNWENLLYLHADTGELNVKGGLTCTHISNISTIHFSNDGWVPYYRHCGWSNSLTAQVSNSTHCLILINQDYVGLCWIAGANNDLNIFDIKGDRSNYNIYMSSRTSLTVEKSENFTGTIIVFV